MFKICIHYGINEYPELRMWRQTREEVRLSIHYLLSGKFNIHKIVEEVDITKDFDCYIKGVQAVLNRKDVISTDGIADGGGPYTVEELKIINK